MMWELSNRSDDNARPLADRHYNRQKIGATGLRRGKPMYGYCYYKAGFEHVGFTKGGLWAWQLLPEKMPPAEFPINSQMVIA